MYRDKSGVEVLLGPPRIEMAEMITPRDIERLLSLMRKVYNVVLIDTATTVDDTVLSYFDHSDVIVQIVNYEWMVMQRARAMAEKIAGKGPLAIGRAKRIMDLGQSLDLPHACNLEADTFASLFDTADQKEGMKAFLEKRPASFKGQ